MNKVTEPGDPNFPTVMTTYHMVRTLDVRLHDEEPFLGLWVCSRGPSLRFRRNWLKASGVTTGGYVSVTEPEKTRRFRLAALCDTALENRRH